MTQMTGKKIISIVHHLIGLLFLISNFICLYVIRQDVFRYNFKIGFAVIIILLEFYAECGRIRLWICSGLIDSLVSLFIRLYLLILDAYLVCFCHTHIWPI